MGTRVYIQTHGCAINFHESEIMAALLKKADFELISNIEEAFLVVLNVCTVKGIFTATREIKRIKEQFPYKKLVIAGCITKDLINEINKIAPEASLISTHNIKEIVSVVEEALHDNPVRILAKSGELKINLPKIRRNPIIAIVPINEGCNGYCSYCSVKSVKGNLLSYPKEMIIKEVKSALADGCREIWLTSQDTGAYGAENGSSGLPALLTEISSIPGSFIVRVGMMNPDNVLSVLDSLIAAFKSPKIFKFLHLPVQSGNNNILQKMKRKYTVEDFKEIIKRFRKEIPNITLSTDIICGFPGETAEQFNDSIALVKQLMPDVLNISRFRPRPGTDAAKMSQLESSEIKRRTALLTGIFDWIAFEQNKRFRNWKGKILIDEHGKNSTFVGRNIYYKPVIVEGNFNLGDELDVVVTKTTRYDLRAMVIKI